MNRQQLDRHLSARDWKPGDVAVAQAGESTFVIFRAEVPSKGGEVRWHDKFGPLLADGEWPYGRRIRPLVVIDPEDREQVERLVKIVSAGFPKIVTGLAPGDTETLDRIYVEHFAAALREFANPTPPKPDEPQGLGAVVEDADGEAWVNAHPQDKYPWVRNTRDGYESCLYADISAVRVLSEGVAS